MLLDSLSFQFRFKFHVLQYTGEVTVCSPNEFEFYMLLEEEFNGECRQKFYVHISQQHSQLQAQENLPLYHGPLISYHLNLTS